jgi:hypothetical protein
VAAAIVHHSGGMTMHITDGMRSSEFWLAMATKVVALILIAFGSYTDNTEMVTMGIALIGTAGGTYAISRGLAKKQETK